VEAQAQQPNDQATPPPAQNLPAVPSKNKTMKDWLKGDEFKVAMASALPSHMPVDRFIRIALTALMKVPKIAQCTQHSLFKCMLDCGSLGLEPDGRRAHIIPYENRKAGTVEAQLIIDYKGLIELSKRSGEVKNWRAEIVCENDDFSWENGIVTHKVDWFNPRGKALAVYSHVRNTKDVDDYEVMTLAEVGEIRKRSKAANSGPWVTDFNEMAKKTVIRRHSKRLTLSPEFMEALQKDADRFDDIAMDMTGAIEAEVIPRAESIKNKLRGEVSPPPQAEQKAAAPDPETQAVDSEPVDVPEPPANFG
jgi:recombinase, phage RecT family